MMAGNKNTFCVDTSYSSDCLYCYGCNTNASQLFGCVSVKKKSYCILNKQYTKEAYEELVPKIIEHMRKTPYQSPAGSGTGQEWGEGFRIDIAPWAYNETEAQQYFPLDETQAAARSWKWRGKDLKEHLAPTALVSDKLSDASSELTKERFACSQCNKNYKIIQQELDSHRSLGVPLPLFCPDCRHAHRMQKRHPRILWDRSCAQCEKPMQTTYAQERPEIVYCEECYLKEVY